MRKIYILDTNALIYEPRSLFAFDDNEVVIPLTVLDELDKHKNGITQSAKHARMVIRSLDEMRALGNINEGVLTERGGIIRVELNNIDNVPDGLDSNRPDNRIISVALNLKKKHSDKKVIIITKDINLRVKANSLEVEAQDYTSDTVIENLDDLYSGHTKIIVDRDDIDNLYKLGQIPVKNITRPLFPNEYVHLVSNTNEQHSALAKFNGLALEKIRTFDNIWGISARNREQLFAFDALFDQDIKLVTLSGRAGVGKTLLAAATGVEQLLGANKIYKRMVLTRPVVELGNSLGFLPGSLSEKMHPWMSPLYDNLDLIFSDKGRNYLESCMDNGIMKVEPMTYIRGRSLPKSYIIADEAQNLSRHEVKTLITRVGDDSKIILTGDTEQIDSNLDPFSNGLSYVIEKFKNEPIAAHVKLTKGERSELATLASEIL